MKSTEFTYWLQGFFEIGDGNPEIEHQVLLKSQVVCVLAHLKMVFEYEKNKASAFCNWLQGFLADKECLTASQVGILKNRLSEEFEHVIDPSYGDKELQDALTRIHSNRPFGPDTRIKC